LKICFRKRKLLMTDSKVLAVKYSRLVLLVIVIAAMVYFIGSNVQRSWNIFIAVMGFSAVVFIHECGHFITAKLSDIKVETFSIFLPPVLIGIRRTQAGLRIRVLPTLLPKDGAVSTLRQSSGQDSVQAGSPQVGSTGSPQDASDGASINDGLLSFTIPIKNSKAGETEYRIGLIPIAGYVKMLGQDDTGADKQSADPRSFGNKSVWSRMAVISSGVIFNVIAAILIMMVVYLVGINRPPAVVGGVIPDSPAARAGLRAGDEIVEIAGKSDDLDFGNIMMASALSGNGEKVAMKVKHGDGSIEDVAIAAEPMRGMPIKAFGFEMPVSLTVAGVEKKGGQPVEGTELQAGDKIKSVNGKAVETYWDFIDVVEKSLLPVVEVAAERNGEPKLIESQIKLDLSYADGDVKSEADLNHICSMVPRMRVTLVSNVGTERSGLQKDDIILAAGDINNPTYKELRDVTTAHENLNLLIKVLRVDEKGNAKERKVVVVPRKPRGSDRVIIGIIVAFDAEHPVVAKTIAVEDGPRALEIPRGAVITAVDGVKVSNFYDIIREINRNVGERITIEYRLNDEVAGDVSIRLTEAAILVKDKSVPGQSIMFEPLQRLYKAKGVADAFVMGCKKSVWFIVQTYITIKGLLAQNVSLDAMSGPVGIATMSYHAVEQSFVTFLYLLAFISANLAVINFLPIPVVDGGVFVLLIVEKIKGGPLSVRIQEIIAYCGIILLVALFLYLTYNDILRLVWG
jgi:regulator of sigma E protease